MPCISMVGDNVCVLEELGLLPASEYRQFGWEYLPPGVVKTEPELQLGTLPSGHGRWNAVQECSPAPNNINSGTVSLPADTFRSHLWSPYRLKYSRSRRATLVSEA